MQEAQPAAADQAAQHEAPAAVPVPSPELHAPAGRRGCRALTKAERAHLHRAIVHTEAASAALAAIATPELVLSAQALRQLANAACHASNTARAALRQLRPLAYNEPQ